MSKPGPTESSQNETPAVPTVLSVDDSPTNRYVRSGALRAAGFQVIEASTGVDALALALEAQPSLVVLDIRLPDLNGFEVCQRLKSDPRTQSIPILHVSAVGRMENDLPEALEHQSDAYLREPVDPETLVATVRALIRAREAELREREGIRRSEAKYRHLLEAAFEGVWVVDASGRTEFVNARMAEMLKYSSPEGLFGRDAFEFVAEEDRGDLKARFAERLSGDGREPYEIRLRCRDGSIIWVSISESTLYDERGRNTGRMALFTDITDRKLAEEALLQSEARERARAAELEAVMDTVPVVTFVSHDPECREIIGNRMTYELLRLTPGTNLSASAPETEKPTSFRIMKDGREIPPQDLPVQKAASTGQPVRNCDFDVVFEDGACRNLLGDAVPLFGEDGRPRGAVGGFIDVTDRKRTEERLRETQKLESIGLLAGGIAHEFNNLLTGIMGNASMVLDEIGPGHAEHLREVISGAERAAHLTRQLLAYAGKGRFVVRDVDVSQAVNEMSDLAQFSIPKTVGLKLDLEKRLPSLRMDPSQLQQVLMNLVINAGEAIGESNPGSITVSTGVFDVERAFVDAMGQEVSPRRYVCMEVSDTGRGIDDQSKSRIFDPFFTTKFTGRGLGLAAVAGIVRAQRGGITVESEPGRGSTFRVLLPAAELRTQTLQPQTNANVRATILVVDDEPSVRDFIGAVLRRRGYRLLMASDGRDALAVCENEGGKIDAAIVDVVMPVMGASDLTPELKARQPEIKILLTSGYSETEAKRLCSGDPGAAFIQKPYTAQQIANALERLLDVEPAS